MLQVIASLHNNIGSRAFEEGDLAKAKERYLSALEIREAIGDPEGAFDTLVMLVRTARGMGESAEACAYLHQSLNVIRFLKQIDIHRWRFYESQTEAAIRELGCPEVEAAPETHPPFGDECPRL
jgi:hypothetical protein